MNYRDHATIFRYTGIAGAQDASTGVFTQGANAATTYFDGAVDVQDTGFVMTRDAMGLPTSVSDGAMFLEDESVLPFLTDGDLIHMTMADGTVADAEVKIARKIDGLVMFKWAH